MARGTKRGYVRRTRAQWQRLVDEQAASGLSGREFCARRQIAYATFCARKRELGTEPKKRPSGAFVEVALDHDTPAPGWDVELELGDGVVLRVRRR